MDSRFSRNKAKDTNKLAGLSKLSMIVGIPTVAFTAISYQLSSVFHSVV